MNNLKKKTYRNTSSFIFMAWGSFAFFVILVAIGLYTLKEPLMVKVVRDNQEDEERYNQMFRAVDVDNEK